MSETEITNDPIIELLGPHLRLMKIRTKTSNHKVKGYKAEIRNNTTLIWAFGDTPMAAIRRAKENYRR